MRVPLFGIGMQGKSPTVTAKRLQNCFLEYRPQGEESQVVCFGTPGLEVFTAFGDTKVRGKPLTFEATDKFYCVHRGTLWQVDNAAVQTSIGSLNTTSGNVSMAHNGTQVMVVDGTYGYIYNTSTLVFAQITDVDFPSNPQTVIFQDGYFIVNKGLTGQFNISAPYDGLNWGALDLAIAESNPDPLVSVAPHPAGGIALLGVVSSENWQNTGAQSFPYARLAGANNKWGCASATSVTEYAGSLAYLAKNADGQVVVVKLNGYVPVPISTPDLDTIINGYSTVADATAFAYLLGGHPFLQMSFPSAARSWLYDGSTGIWGPLKSASIERHRAEFGFNFLNQTMVTDYANGNIYRLKADVYTDNGGMIEREIIGEHWGDPDLSRRPIDCIRLDMETGVGLTSGQGSDPQIMMQCSKDKGRSYGVERWRSVGKIGEYKKVVEWRNWGSSRDWNFKLRYTEPTRFCITGAIVNPQD